ncbi:glycosyltransferase family 2 protein [Heliobacterium gestii]|uniref:Glycosyltransferase family 2 protein n=1 Tax=Heliomicrobium gestii TaxID=2699 RepID=A0A845L8R3_HELGE|nr:glycosyltransferase family 2 protein [Heliomicrobium gestii]MBM7866698.1 hypothetical protein [Heliomicrobium gestii]MZP43022.1 glycosyltransferase family 2 protein [Heliomicrobium gestii]
MNAYAPIALFVYKRPNHTRKTLESLRRCPEAAESELFVFCDGPKAEDDGAAIQETRQVVREQSWCKEVTVIESDHNRGLAASVIGGVTEIVNRFGQVIVLEDDLRLSPAFLRFMNASLARYSDDPKVMHVSGYMHPIDVAWAKDALFLPIMSSWGWATWKRAWDRFDPDCAGVERLFLDHGLRRAFDIDDGYSQTTMLLRQLSGQIDSWAIRWYWSMFTHGGVSLFPKNSLVVNRGMDGTGTHCAAIDSVQEQRIDGGAIGRKETIDFPETTEWDPVIFEQVSAFFRRTYGHYWTGDLDIASLRTQLLGRPVAIFGSGSLGRQLYTLLKKVGVPVNCYVDNDRSKWKETLDGLPIQSPDAVGRETFFFIASSWKQEIAAQLTGAGYSEKKDFLCWN